MTRQQARILALVEFPTINLRCVEMFAGWIQNYGLAWTHNQVELDPGLLFVPNGMPRWMIVNMELPKGVRYETA